MNHWLSAVLALLAKMVKGPSVKWAKHHRAKRAMGQKGSRAKREKVTKGSKAKRANDRAKRAKTQKGRKGHGPRAKGPIVSKGPKWQKAKKDNSQ